MSRVIKTLLVAVLALATTAFGLPTEPSTDPASSAQSASWPTPGLDGLRALDVAADEPFVGIATFQAGPPTEQQTARLRDLGLVAQPMQELPMAIVYGTKAQHLSAATVPGIVDVYPDVEPLDYHWDVSNDSMNVPAVHEELGVTGEGVGIAIVDSGIDATHENLAEPTKANFQIIGPEYLSILGVETSPEVSKEYLAVPVDQGPYNNSDTIGHGTHVAGIAAGDQDAGDPALTGVAPDADLIGYGTGQVLFIFTIIASFDHILQVHEEYNIKVVNNSWGSSFQQFNPMHPTNVATKALFDAGMFVTFSAGNSETEMTVNPWSVAPWVTSVSSTTVAKARSGFSSGGLMYDNSFASGYDEDGHARYDGHRVGMYHPDVAAPGSDILSAGTPTGIGVVSPTPPNGSTKLSGTSMSAPQIAGLGALLFEANPELTPWQVRRVLQVTSVPLSDDSTFWQAGYGFVDAEAAVRYVQHPGFSEQKLHVDQAKLDREVRFSTPYRNVASDHFTYAPLPATVGGLDSKSWEIDVEDGIDAIRASISFPPDLGVADLNLLFDWGLTITDAAGTEVLTTALEGTGAGYAQVELAGTDYDYSGPWTATISGNLSSQEPSLLFGGDVTAVVAQLVQQDPIEWGAPAEDGPTFRPSQSALELAFAPREDNASPASSPEGCAFDSTVAPDGLLTTEGGGDTCAAGLMGYATNYGAGVPGSFTSPPLAEPLVIGGTGSFTIHIADEAHSAWSNAFASTPSYTLSAVAEDGTVTPIAGSDLEYQGTGEQTFEIGIPPTEIPAGSAIRLELNFTGFYTSASRLLYGGEFASSLVLPTGTFR